MIGHDKRASTDRGSLRLEQPLFMQFAGAKSTSAGERKAQIWSFIWSRVQCLVSLTVGLF